MTWNNFIQIAYPKELSIQEARQNFIFKSHRWLGLKLAYLFYHLHISANILSVLRILMAAAGLYIIFNITVQKTYLNLIGIFLLYGQNILDYSDGAIARARKTISVFGGHLDGIVNVFARGTFLILISVYSQNILLITLTGLAIFLLINFREAVGHYLGQSLFFKTIQLIYRITLSIQFMLFVIPLLFLVLIYYHYDIVFISLLISYVYIGLALLWFILCLWKKSN